LGFATSAQKNRAAFCRCRLARFSGGHLYKMRGDESLIYNTTSP
jgi:hypothetical protein